MKYLFILVSVTFLLMDQSYAEDKTVCNSRIQNLIGWRGMEYNEDLQKTRLSELNKVPQFKVECKKTIQYFLNNNTEFDTSYLKKVLAQAPLEMADAESRIKAFDEGKKKSASGACHAAHAMESFCNDQRGIRLMELQIQQEQAIAKETGVIAAGTVHTAAQNKIVMQQAARADAKAYESAAGKAISVDDCKLVGDEFPNVSVTAPIDQQVKAACTAGN